MSPQHGSLVGVKIHAVLFVVVLIAMSNGDATLISCVLGTKRAAELAVSATRSFVIQRY